MATLTKAQPRNRQIIYFLLSFSVLGVLLILVSTSKYGAGCWPDSVAYISTARNLLSGNGYFRYAELPFVEWPPLWPTLLAFFGLIGFDPLDVARYINAIFFGLIVFLSGMWLLKHISSRALVLLGSLAILFSTPLIRNSAFMGTEPLFVVFVLLFILEVELFLSSGKPLPFFLAAIFAALACLTRYIGVTIVFTGLLLLLIKRNITVKNRLTKGIALILICTLPMIVWVSRNYMISSTLVGERHPSSYTLGQNIYFTLDTVTRWFMPPSSLVETSKFSTLPEQLQELLQLLTLPPATRVAIGILLSLLITGAFVLIIGRNQNRGKSTSLSQIMPLLCFVVIYTIYLVTSATFVSIDILTHRLLSPIYVPLVLLIIFMIDNILRFSHEHFSRQTLGRFLLVGSTLLLVVYPFLFSGWKTINRIKEGAGGYSHVSYRNSPLISYMQENPLDGQVYSNRPDYVYILTGIPVKFSPGSAEDALLLKEYLVSKDSNTYLVWFKDRGWESLPEIGEFDFMFDMEIIATVSDGVIYLIK